jgi:hypothetical protein
MRNTPLLQRLERLEVVSEIRDEAIVVRIVFVDGDGSQTPGPIFHCARKASRPRRTRRLSRVDVGYGVQPTVIAGDPR